jgi:hypothetical protein
VITTTTLTIDAADARTGDTLLVGQSAHLILSTWRRRHMVEMRYSTGTSTIAADARIQIRRRVRIVDHDAESMMYPANP